MCERAQIHGLELRVLDDAALLLPGLESLLELGGRHAEHDVAVHLDEAPVRVPREALIVRCARQRLDGLIVQPEVQDRVHHPRHGDGRTAPDRQ